MEDDIDLISRQWIQIFKKMENLLSKLREETTELHLALHQHPVLQACQEGTMDRAAYIHLLKAFYSPWKLLSPAIDSVPIAALKPKLQFRAKAIHHDLVHLKVDQKVLKLTNPQKTLTKEKLLGICYVLIGSSMGAGMLSASIKASLGDVPVSYLSMTPKEAGWPELVGSLRTLEAKDYPTAAGAAVDIFQLIQDQLSS